MTPAILLSTAARAESPKTWIDHIVLGVGRLDQGIDSFHRQTGVTPEFGGEHPGVGTHNALAALGGKTYLEILAPRPGATVHDGWQGLAELDHLAPMIWAVGVADIDQVSADLRTAGFETTPPAAGSRKTPNGSTLKWKTASIVDPNPTPAPFLIEWGQDVSHPASTSPEGCSLAEFILETPDAPTLKRLLSALQLDVTVKPSAEARITVRLNSPSGPVTFQS